MGLFQSVANLVGADARKALLAIGLGSGVLALLAGGIGISVLVVDCAQALEERRADRAFASRSAPSAIVTSAPSPQREEPVPAPPTVERPRVVTTKPIDPSIRSLIERAESVRAHGSSKRRDSDGTCIADLREQFAKIDALSRELDELSAGREELPNNAFIAGTQLREAYFWLKGCNDCVPADLGRCTTAGHKLRNARKALRGEELTDEELED